MKDPRDGTIYNTVTIGGQRWMAENLDYKTGTSWCYDNDPKNCETYGRLYDWETAKSACPSGWHLPTDAEWTTLENTVDRDALGLMDTSMNGTNAWGFTVLPGGYISRGTFSDLDISGYFCSASEYPHTSTPRSFNCSKADVYRGTSGKFDGFSLRCLENGSPR
jgi:uncharacterized protein (TIGR02145 family)